MVWGFVDKKCQVIPPQAHGCLDGKWNAPLGKSIHYKHDFKKEMQVALEKDEWQAKLLTKAQSAFEKYHMDMSSCKDSKWVDMMKWVLPAASVKFLLKDFKKKDDIVVKFATLRNVWTSYIPPRGATLENATLEDTPEDTEAVVAEVAPIAALVKVAPIAKIAALAGVALISDMAEVATVAGRGPMRRNGSRCFGGYSCHGCPS